MFFFSVGKSTSLSHLASVSMAYVQVKLLPPLTSVIPLLNVKQYFYFMVHNYSTCSLILQLPQTALCGTFDLNGCP